MTPVKLHVFPPSPNSRKVIFLNAHLDLNLPLEMVDLRNGAQKAPDFLALNPNGKVPVLEFDDGSTLWESNVILNRLAGIAESDLWPRSDQRYDILRWQSWEAAHWTPACAPYIGYHLFNDTSVNLDAAAETFHRFAAVLDGHLKGRDWLAGAEMTAADISVGAILALRAACHYPLDGYANITAWMARLEAVKGWSAADEMMRAA